MYSTGSENGDDFHLTVHAYSTGSENCNDFALTVLAYSTGSENGDDRVSQTQNARDQQDRQGALAHNLSGEQRIIAIIVIDGR